MSKLCVLLLAVGFLCLIALPLSAGTVSATGEGWCADNTIWGCNNTNTSVITNMYAGNESDVVIRDWMAFDIPAIGSISNATLWIWNDYQDLGATQDTTRTYTLHNPAAIDFDSLGSGAVLGSVGVGVANTGESHYVGIPLNGTALALLNAAQGGQFLFGGALDIVNPNLEVDIFGYTNGTPVAYLEYNSVPEPGTLAMLLGGLAALGMAARRRRA